MILSIALCLVTPSYDGVHLLRHGIRQMDAVVRRGDKSGGRVV